MANSVLALPTPSPPPVYGGQLANISTRAIVQTGDNIPIAGFIITGTKAKKVVVRGIGPSLATAGVQGALQDPTLDLFDAAGHLVASNDNWKDSQQAALAYSLLSPPDDREAAILATLSPGAYTVVLRGKDQSTGVSLVEVYDIDPANSNLSNISTRGVVGSGDNVMIGGVILKNSNAKIVARAIGPSLNRFGVGNALADPNLELHDSQGVTIAANDDWQDSEPAEIWNTGLGPTDSHESVIRAVLSPGNYTAVVGSKDGSTGVGLIEIYQLE